MKLLAIAAICVLALVSLACDPDGESSSSSPTATATNTPAPSPTPTVTSTSTPTPQSNVCQPNPDPASASILVINSPSANASVQGPITVTGQVAAFEAVFQMTLYNAAGNEIATATGMAQEGQTLSPFSEQITFPASAAGPACLWVWQESAQDGSVTKVGQVPLTLLP